MSNQNCQLRQQGNVPDLDIIEPENFSGLFIIPLIKILILICHLFVQCRGIVGDAILVRQVEPIVRLGRVQGVIDGF